MRKWALLLSAAAIAASANHLSAAISYTNWGSTYTQNFNSFPLQYPNGTTVSQASGAVLQGPTMFPEGWRDDTTSNTQHISIPGWYLYGEKDNLPASDPSNTEGGFNGHQRLRYNTGSATASSFYAFASVNSAEKALGTISGTAIDADGRAYIGAAFVNDSNVTLTSFTIKYRGEQWRRGAGTALDFLDFQYSLTKTAATWGEPNGYSGIAHSFDAPQNDAVALMLNGNDSANYRNISHTFPISPATFNWLPGQTLFIRWRENNVSGGEDGLAIDDVEFTAVPEPTSLAVLGLAAVGVLGRRRSR